MSRILANIANTEAPSADYPKGRVLNQDNTANPPIPGTPILEEIYGDIIQFFKKLIGLAAITENNLPDNETNGYQFIDALDARIHEKCVTDKGDVSAFDFQIGDFTADGLVHTLDISGKIPATAKMVLLRVVAVSSVASSPGAHIYFKKYNNSNYFNIATIIPQVNNIAQTCDVWVAVDSNRKIDYIVYNVDVGLTVVIGAYI